MGLPSPIHRTGLVGSSAILPGWSGTRGGDRMAERLGLPVRVRNDADLGARRGHLGRRSGPPGRGLPQAHTGSAPASSSAASCSRGWAARPARSATPPWTRRATLPLWKQGLPRDLRGGAALARLLGRSRGQELDLDGVLSMAAEGDPACRRALRDAGRHIGVALANLCNLVNPERIVVGGTMGYAGDLLLDPIREAVGLRAIPSAAEDVEVVLGELGERAELLGAVALVLHEAGPAWNGRIRRRARQRKSRPPNRRDG